MKLSKLPASQGQQRSRVQRAGDRPAHGGNVKRARVQELGALGVDLHRRHAGDLAYLRGPATKDPRVVGDGMIIRYGVSARMARMMRALPGLPWGSGGVEHRALTKRTSWVIHRTRHGTGEAVFQRQEGPFDEPPGNERQRDRGRGAGHDEQHIDGEGVEGALRRKAAPRRAIAAILMGMWTT